MTKMASAADLSAHEHVFLGVNHDEYARRTLWVVGLTTVMMIGEIAAGSVFHSMALLADGFRMATHAGALAVAAGAYAFARRYARDPRFSFGTGKVGDLAGFASALALALVALAIAYESFTRFFRSSSVAFEEATVVAAVGLVVNIASALVLSGGHHHEHDHHHVHAQGLAPAGPATRHADNNLRSALLHVMADALTSLLAIAALLAGRYLDWQWLDPAMGVIGAVVIASWSWNLMRQTAAVLLDTNDPHLQAEVRELLAREDTHITDLHVWRVAPGCHAAIVGVAGNVECHEVRRRLADVHELVHITIEKS
jgi:cation diffusion facilitator family transporter